MQNVLKILGVLATIGILLVVLAGAVVTKTDSGDGCGPNWPLCHDRLIPENPTLETVIEYTHRLVTLIVGILVIVFSLWAAIKYRKHREVFWMAGASLFFLFFQSALGAIAVVYGQSSAGLALHFGFSLLSYASVFLLTIYVFQLSKGNHLPTTNVSPGLKYGLLGLITATYVVIYTGAYVRHTGSMLACPDWPLCNGQVIPPLFGQVGIHFTHRTAAYLLFIGFIILFLHVRKHYQSDKTLVLNSNLMLALVLLQIVTGVASVLTQLSFTATLLHALIITILFGFQSYITLYALRRPAV